MCIQWFLTLFSNVLHIRILLRVWDLLMCDGSCVLFQITLAMLKMNERALCAADNSSAMFQILSDIPAGVHDVDLLMETAIRVASSVNKNSLEAARRKHQAYLMAQEGTLISENAYQNLAQMLPLSKERPRNLQNDTNNNNSLEIGTNKVKQLLSKMVRKSKSSVGVAAAAASGFEEQANENSTNNTNNTKSRESKTKNVMQTELLVNLRRVILKLAHHFQANDPETRYLSATAVSPPASSPPPPGNRNPKGFDEQPTGGDGNAGRFFRSQLSANSNSSPETGGDTNRLVVDLQADYSIESHAADYERYMTSSTSKQAGGGGRSAHHPGQKRAKALFDFEKTDEDELGFKKNDLITVLSTKDDHCWIGYTPYFI